jgi:hypothetical protein
MMATQKYSEFASAGWRRTQYLSDEWADTARIDGSI